MQTRCVLCGLPARLEAKRKESGGSLEHLQRLEQDHDWIVREKANFGKGEYDFTQRDIAKIFK